MLLYLIKAKKPNTHGTNVTKPEWPADKNRLSCKPITFSFETPWANGNSFAFFNWRFPPQQVH